MAAIVVAAGVMGWWMENGRNKEDETKNTMVEEQEQSGNGGKA